MTGCLGRAEGVPGPGGGDLQPEGGPQQTPQDCPADRTLSQVSHLHCDFLIYLNLYRNCNYFVPLSFC